jgi:hypothetical protein
LPLPRAPAVDGRDEVRDDVSDAGHDSPWGRRVRATAAAVVLLVVLLGIGMAAADDREGGRLLRPAVRAFARFPGSDSRNRARRWAVSSANARSLRRTVAANSSSWKS